MPATEAPLRSPMPPSASPAAVPRHRPPRGKAPAPQALATPAALGPFFSLAFAAPAAMRALGPLAAWIIPAVAPGVRRVVRLNSARIFGHPLPPAQQRRFTRRTIRNFYDFVCDVGSAASLNPSQLQSWIHRVEGLDAYRAARAQRRGAVLINAHLGSFEAGLAALASVEPRIRVIFQRDASPQFERLRSRLRQRLGIIESPIDDGWASWLPLRQALLNDEVVVMQGDRAISGQRSITLPFLHGHLRIPTGPVRLARLTNSPIIPVFAPRQPEEPGRYAVLLGSPIQPSSTGDDDLHALARAMQAVITRHPDQWLLLHPAFDEDAPHAP
jgi:lauroyl/myristoyl acyltransferase